ncbi:MAG: type II toxin-antitoxin system HigB family toxin [Alphaproteobacteria bacterium]|nr:type II toxin-antitoxin system HigB family toxin [Alphaproteobacteria bacterium]
MIVIDTETVERYFAAHRGARGIRAGRSRRDVRPAFARHARTGATPEDVKASHPRASTLKGGRVVFNIKANDQNCAAQAPCFQPISHGDEQCNDRNVRVMFLSRKAVRVGVKHEACYILGGPNAGAAVEQLLRRTVPGFSSIWERERLLPIPT